MLRWQLERLLRRLPPNPDPSQLPRCAPEIAYPHAAQDELRVTWVGHATWLIQNGSTNILTDPHWSDRASPYRSLGPRRFSPPGVEFGHLPRIDAVLLSHDHYDHLDESTVRRLKERYGGSLRWYTPPGYRNWFARRGIEVTELAWWESAGVEAEGEPVRVQSLPAQHWSSRSPFDRLKRAWGSWAASGSGGAVYFGGDSGFFPGYAAIGRTAGPFDFLLLPIGAYEPRWFMKASHMNPEDALQAYLLMGGKGVLAGMHWGTFRLTDEDPLEPPTRMRKAWTDAGLPPADLWIPRHGETRSHRRPDL